MCLVQRVLDDEADNRAVLTVDKCRWAGSFRKEIKVQKIHGYLREVAST